MTYELLLKILDQAPDDHCIMGFMFGSGYKYIYKKGNTFNRETHINKELNCVIMNSEDCRDRPFIVYGLIDDITHVYIATDPSKGPIDVTSSIML